MLQKYYLLFVSDKNPCCKKCMDCHTDDTITASLLPQQITGPKNKADREPVTMPGMKWYCKSGCGTPSLDRIKPPTSKWFEDPMPRPANIHSSPAWIARQGWRYAYLESKPRPGMVAAHGYKEHGNLLLNCCCDLLKGVSSWNCPAANWI